MLQNASSLGKISFDTAEDEPSKIWETSASFANEALDPADCVPGAGVRVGVRGPEVRLEVPRAGEVPGTAVRAQVRALYGLLDGPPESGVTRRMNYSFLKMNSTK